MKFVYKLSLCLLVSAALLIALKGLDTARSYLRKFRSSQQAALIKDRMHRKTVDLSVYPSMQHDENSINYHFISHSGGIIQGRL